jgi:hypothetical protein
VSTLTVPLFSNPDLRSVLENQTLKMYEEIDAVDADRILNTSTEDWCDYLEDKYRAGPLALDEAGITTDQAETQLDVSGDLRRAVFDRNRPLYITGTKVSFYVPYSGDKGLLLWMPSSFRASFPRAAVHERELVYTYMVAEHDAEVVKREFERDLGLTRDFVGFVNNDVGPFNDRVRGFAKARVETRKAKLLKDQGMVAALGYPLKRATGVPTTYAVPVVRRKVQQAPTPKGVTPFVPEPMLAQEEYEHVLEVVSNMVAVMERSPKAFAHMEEEHLRDHFLVQLNGQYEGQATGETFNDEGKTDILLRVDGKNIFIAECKFWGGPAKLTEAIDQLLSYTCWRDTKTAMLLFNRTKNFSAVLGKIPDTVKAHPNCKRQVDYTSETGFRFIFAHRDDANRELTLTVLVFEVPK